MTDAEHAAVLRRHLKDGLLNRPERLWVERRAAIERAIELLEREAPCVHCGGGGAHPGACRWCGKAR